MAANDLLENYDNDHDLRCLRRRRVGSGQISVNEWELKNLEEVHQKTTVQHEFLKKEHEKLKTEKDQQENDFQAERLRHREEINKITAERDSLKTKLQNEEEKNAAMANVCVQQTKQVSILLAQLPTASYTQRQQSTPSPMDIMSASSPRQSGDESGFAELAHGPSSFCDTPPMQAIENLKSQMEALRNENRDMRMKLSRISRSHGNGQIHRVRHRSWELSDNAGWNDDESPVTRKQGRFEVHQRSFECSRCHLAFDTEDQANTSVCSYHSAKPLPQDIEGSRYFLWPCCNLSGRTQSTKGCRVGDHVIVKTSTVE